LNVTAVNRFPAHSALAVSMKSGASSATFGQQLSVLKAKLWQTITPEELRYREHSHKAVQSISEYNCWFSVWWDPLVWSLLQTAGN